MNMKVTKIWLLPCVVTIAWWGAAAASVYDVGPSRSLRTLAEARDRIRADRASHLLADDETATVFVDPGVYPLPDGFALDRRDSRTAWISRVPHGARLVGGTILRAADFKPVAEPSVRARLDTTQRTHVVVCDLARKGIGKLEPFADQFRGQPGPFLYMDGEEMTLARWPNANAVNKSLEWTSFTNVTDHGWAEKESPDPSRRVDHPGAFIYDASDRIRRWNLKEGVWLNGYWCHDWYDCAVRIASFDPKTREVRLSAKVHYNIAGGTLGHAERRFYAFNLLEELDAPGEYFLDRRKRKLYFWPKDGFAKAEIVLATLDDPVVRMHCAKHVVFRGFDVKGSQNAGVHVKDSEAVTIDGCRVTCVGGSGIVTYGTRLRVVSCEVANVGEAGVWVGGGDTRNLISGENMVEECHIHHFAQHVRTYRAGVMIPGSAGAVVRRNEIHDAPHVAILYGGVDNVFEYNEIYRCVYETADSGVFYTGRSWISQGNVIRYNYIHDCGPKNDTGHTVGVYFDDVDCGDEVFGNVFRNMGRGVFIGGGRDHPVRNNVFWNCAEAVFMDDRGVTWKQWNTPKGNWDFENQAERMNYRNPPWSCRFPNLAKTMQDSPREPLHNPIERNVIVNSILNDIAILPRMTNMADRLAPIADNLIVHEPVRGRPYPWKARINPWRIEYGTPLAAEGVKSVDLGFSDPDNGDFTLRKDAAVLKLVPGFVAIPFEKIGRGR